MHVDFLIKIGTEIIRNVVLMQYYGEHLEFDNYNNLYHGYLFSFDIFTVRMLYQTLFFSSFSLHLHSYSYQKILIYMQNAN